MQGEWKLRERGGGRCEDFEPLRVRRVPGVWRLCAGPIAEVPVGSAWGCIPGEQQGASWTFISLSRFIR